MEQTMIQEKLFCHGCNEKFAVADDERQCPQCGQTLTELDDAATVEYADMAARGTMVGGQDDSAGSDEELIGTDLGIYHLNAFLGKGGMARVYRAKHLMLERPCAIKVLNPQLVARNPEYVKMFLSEARAAASLVHPNVVTIHTIGHDRGLHFIEMEYIIGRSLHRFLESAGRLDPTQATQFIVQICSALAEAHRMDMVHRDIKPGNVLVTSSGAAKLADFGLAKQVVAAGRSPQGYTPAGTPYYMAPELFTGTPADKRSDVYAMGVTYFFLLSSRLPYVDQSFMELAVRHAKDPVPDIRQVRSDAPDEANAVIQRALAKKPADRHADASELYDELRAVYGGLRSLQSLLTDALAGTDVELQGVGNRFTIRVPLPGTRSQGVVVESCRGAAIAEQVIKIFSVCGPANDTYFRRALELNAEMPHGSIAIEQIDGRLCFVMANAYPRATCDPEEIRRSVLMIAKHADQVEQFLTTVDHH